MLRRSVLLSAAWRARVAGYKKVRAVEFVEEIPRSPSGKILRRALVDRERKLAQR